MIHLRELGGGCWRKDFNYSWIKVWITNKRNKARSHSKGTCSPTQVFVARLNTNIQNTYRLTVSASTPDSCSSSWTVIAPNHQRSRSPALIIRSPPQVPVTRWSRCQNPNLRPKYRQSPTLIYFPFQNIFRRRLHHVLKDFILISQTVTLWQRTILHFRHLIVRTMIRSGITETARKTNKMDTLVSG